MRDLILEWLEAHAVAGFTTTAELPWDSSGQPLYLNNMKRIYVNLPQTGQDPLIDVLNGAGVVNETTTVSIYLATDAKKQPANYDAVASMIKSTRLDPAITGVTQRATTVSTEFIADVLVSQFDINFRELIVNT
jgi:hypothetical protein